MEETDLAIIIQKIVHIQETLDEFKLLNKEHWDRREQMEVRLAGLNERVSVLERAGKWAGGVATAAIIAFFSWILGKGP
jgi:hypothetical protein